MKIGELQEHCGNCSIIQYCTEPYNTPQICVCEELEHIPEELYKLIAEIITEAEIQDKLKQYEENDVSPWDDERNGAILDLILEKLERKSIQDLYIELLCKKTGFDEITVGCFLSNYGMPQHICPPFSNGWCKDYEKCRVLEKVVADMIQEKEKVEQHGN